MDIVEIHNKAPCGNISPMQAPLSRNVPSLWLPKISVALLLLAVLSLLWVLHLNEQEEQRNTLISDVLWLEQNLRFELSGTAEQVEQLSQDLAREPNLALARELFSVRSGHLRKTRPEVTQLVRTPPKNLSLDTPLNPSAEFEQTLSLALQLATKLHRPQFTEAFLNSERKPRVLLIVGIPNTTPNEYLITSIDLEALLQDVVPWWFAQKYQVRLVNESGLEFARKSNVEAQSTPSGSYDIPLDFPGYGLKLSVTAYQINSNTEQRILSIAIILLSASVVISLWMIRHHMKRRQTTEEALRAEYAFRESMENSLTVGMRARDLEGVMIYANHAFCKMTGFSREELIGCRPPMPYWLPDHLEETYNLHRAVLLGQAPQDGFEVDLGRKNGEIFRALV